MNDIWYVFLHGQYCPTDETVLKQWIREGSIRPTTLVKKQYGVLTEIGNIPEFQTLFKPHVPPKNRYSGVSRRLVAFISLIVFAGMVNLLFWAVNRQNARFVNKPSKTTTPEKPQNPFRRAVISFGRRDDFRKPWMLNPQNTLTLGGSITNKGNIVIEKPYITIDFETEDKTFLTRKTFLVGPLIAPGETVGFKEEIVIPKRVSRVRFKVVNVTDVDDYKVLY